MGDGAGLAVEEEIMKTRESGMPDEEMWQTFFDAEAILRSLGLDATCGDVVDFSAEGVTSYQQHRG